MRAPRLRVVLWVATVCVLLAAGMIAAAGSPAVSNVFDNTFLVDALRDISSQTGIPIVADSTVQGQVTMVLDSVPFEEALNRILAPGGYVFRKFDGYYLVGAPDAKNPSFALLSKTEAVKLRYVKADTAAKVLTESLAQYVKVDKDSNSLVLTAPEAILTRVKADVSLIDRPVAQIMIEAMVVDVTKEGRKNLGLDWGWDYNGKSNPATVQSGTLVVQALSADLGYIPAGGWSEFIVKLKATCDNGEARVEANPRVATLDGQTAEIFVGRDRYYNLTASNENSTTTSARLESIKTGITLKLQPQVADNGEITVRIEPEVSDVVADGNSNGNLPVISRRKVSTTVRVKTGESIVLGGLLQRVDHKIVTRVPVLGYIPILNLLFSSTKTIQEEGEVLIIITPYLVGGPDTPSGRVPKLMTLDTNR